MCHRSCPHSPAGIGKFLNVCSGFLNKMRRRRGRIGDYVLRWNLWAVSGIPDPADLLRCSPLRRIQRMPLRVEALLQIPHRYLPTRNWSIWHLGLLLVAEMPLREEYWWESLQT